MSIVNRKNLRGEIGVGATRLEQDLRSLGFSHGNVDGIARDDRTVVSRCANRPRVLSNLDRQIEKRDHDANRADEFPQASELVQSHLAAQLTWCSAAHRPDRQGAGTPTGFSMPDALRLAPRPGAARRSPGRVFDETQRVARPFVRSSEPRTQPIDGEWDGATTCSDYSLAACEPPRVKPSRRVW